MLTWLPLTRVATVMRWTTRTPPPTTRSTMMTTLTPTVGEARAQHGASGDATVAQLGEGEGPRHCKAAFPGDNTTHSDSPACSNRPHMPSVGYEYYDQGNFYSTPVAKLLYDLATLLSQVSHSQAATLASLPSRPLLSLTLEFVSCCRTTTSRCGLPLWASPPSSCRTTSTT